MSDVPIDAEDYDSRPETWEHIHTVQRHLLDFAARLTRRGHAHDQSKLVKPELALFDEATPKLKDLEYGSEEYKQALAELKPALDHHYAKNSHHPEHYPEGVDEMTLMDIVEMFCDWKAATERMHDGNIRQSLDHNRKRFNISDQLNKIFENTVKELGW